MQQMFDVIPYIFDCWDDSVVHLLLLKISIADKFTASTSMQLEGKVTYNLISSFAVLNVIKCWTVVVEVKWSASSPSALTIRVRIPLKPTVFSGKLN